MESFEEWCDKHDCDHAHCPYDCEHPQPMLDGGDLICGKCLHDSDGEEIVKMVPCTPEICD